MGKTAFSFERSNQKERNHDGFTVQLLANSSCTLWSIVLAISKRFVCTPYICLM
jgi:hypothetical protein